MVLAVTNLKIQIICDITALHLGAWVTCLSSDIMCHIDDYAQLYISYSSFKHITKFRVMKQKPPTHCYIPTHFRMGFY